MHQVVLFYLNLNIYVIYRNIQRFEENSVNKYSSSDKELSTARGQAIDVLKLTCSDRLAKLTVVILSDDDDDDRPVSKRPRQVSPTLSVDEDDDIIGHVKVCFHLVWCGGLCNLIVRICHLFRNFQYHSNYH